MNGKYLEGSVRLINQKAKFECGVEGKPAVVVDYIPPIGDGEGYTSLELFLLSLASCFGSTVKFMLANRMKIAVDAVQVSASGTRRETHPTSFETMTLKLMVKAVGLEPEALEKTIQVAKDTVCPVWAMVKNNVDVVIEYEIVPA